MIKIVLSILFLLIVFFLIVMLIDGNRFHIVTYTITSSKIKKNQKLIFLSDLHNKTYGKDNMQLLQAIEKEKPDKILIAGDMITSKVGTKIENGTRFVRNLGKKYPVYYGMGNHEHKIKNDTNKYGTMFQEFENALKEVHIDLMSNMRVYLPSDNVDIAGLDMDKKYYKKTRKSKMKDTYMESKIGKPRDTSFQILIAHNPEYFKQYVSWGADLILSGHVHGGVMRLPFIGGVISPSFRLFPKFDGGIFKDKDATMILSRGLGMHTIPIRIFNPGELIVIHLQGNTK